MKFFITVCFTFFFYSLVYAQVLPFSKASWITAVEKDHPDGNRPCPVFRKLFQLSKPFKSASLQITAHGLYEAKINGKRVDDGYFTPGYTAYRKRFQYQVYDVGALLNQQNEIRITIGDGWWRGTFGNGGKANNYGDDASLLLNLSIVYTDGSKETISSDSNWQAGTGPIQYSDLYNGETYDARIAESNWQPVKINSFDKANLVLTTTPPVRKHEEFKPVALIGDSIIDFGQNIAGWVKFSVKGKVGDTIKIRHAETLDKDGHFFTGNLRTAKATDTYIVAGNGTETFEPHFTYHGFRYIQVTGCKINKTDFTAIALYTDLKSTGSFSCSNPKLNQLQSNIEWSMKSNFFDIPTDCPQRSERLGWAEDASVFCGTASYLMDVKAFYAKWLMDLAAEQNEDGCVPATAPIAWGDNKDGFAGWGDAATFVPWALYQHYGDRTILQKQYASMVAWVDYISDASSDGLWKADGFGDWYAAGPATDLPYLDQCYWYQSTKILQQTAVLLGKTKDAAYYGQMLKKIKAAFDQHYLNHIPNTQTAYVIGLQFGLLPEEKAKNLVALIKANHNHLATGFMGTPYIMHVLSKYGYNDLAYTLLNQQDCPSWLYMVNKGATTMWEKWDAIKPNGEMQEMSLNHYAFGAIGNWIYENIAGIQAAAPGYQVIRITPQPGGGLTWAKGSYLSKYGLIKSEWQIKNKTITYAISIPKGTTAIIQLPGKAVKTVNPGHYSYTLTYKPIN
ncbi:family 78 glycoside hydrolase catalytic domain [Mucilaginibacter pocheonensis]|uniref:alpha-L-rhamnosidase n=1 Tax=Mucilaginibacter pocheonensis TaxID=398050 RepID=A0ABU1T7N1_9SPHI|nr:family 78 glycoside hydrolase catalytic domain [Mucilaginibacter pocheonensis]MDR6941363.1 alpha-L-rhamnosidase [Mucilaginibacter pocheonensis]